MQETLSVSQIENIGAVIENAADQGRSVLFEHEVYQILEQMDIKTPVHLFLEDEKEITRHALSVFSHNKVVLKVVSEEVTHKRVAGGVRMVHKDLEFIKYSMAQMRKTFERKNIPVAGVLIADYIEYSQDLGNEVLLGFRESEAFGPVISFSKGGTDAEHFARNFSPPNLILAPIDRRWALALLESTRIQEKYIAEGKVGNFAKIVDAGVKLSMISVAFSNFYQSDTRYAITEFEINPFIFDREDHFIALDGFARFEPKMTESISTELKPSETLLPFFEPQGIAVVGVSATDQAKPGNIILTNLARLGRKDLYALNVKGGTAVIDGQEYVLARSMTDIEVPIELAVITVPASATIPVVEQCVEKGVKAIIMIPGGFSEIHKNREAEEKIINLIQTENIRVIGPNCLGLIYAGKAESAGMNTFFVPEQKFAIHLKKDSHVALLSQSGALGITEIYNLRNAISPRVIVSYGNQLDVDPADLIAYLEKDPMIDIVACYIEGFKIGAGRKFFNCVANIKKPVIVYKAGRTEAGKQAAASHTASIAGEYEVTKAAMKQAGVIVADTMLDHGEFIKTFALLKHFSVNGNRVAIIANAGYEKTYAADNLGHLKLAQFDAETLKELEDILPPYVTAEPLLDLTPMATDEMFQQCIEVVMQSNSVDAVFISIVPQGAVIHTTDDEIAQYEENLATRIVNTVQKYKKPTVASINVVSGADAIYNKFGQILDQGGIPTFLSADRAMISLNAFVRYRLKKESKDYSEWLK